MNLKIERDVFRKNEGRLSVLQIMGFYLMLLGVTLIIICSFIEPGEVLPSVIAVSFFVTMLGFAFAFPSLLEGNEGLSTMRIIAFMITNVICMLLLKLGWTKGFSSLGSIGLDQYWMGVIAFVFGAKATQSFFESKMAVTTTADRPGEKDAKNIPENILIEAIEKNDAIWKKQYNVKEVSVGVKKTMGINSDLNCLVFKPVEKIGEATLGSTKIPDFIDFKSLNGELYKIPTDVQKTGGNIIPAFAKITSQSCDSIFPKRPGCSISRSGSNATGTLGIKVYRNEKSYILSCYHVLCAPELEKEVFKLQARAGDVDKHIISPSKEDGGKPTDILGVVTEGVLNDFCDSAIALISNDLDVKEEICRIGKNPSGIISINVNHVKARYPVLMSGRTSKLQRGKIMSSYASADITYEIGGNDYTKTIRGLICASLEADGGDSGAPVVDEDDNLVGIVVAASPQEAYIIPISRLLTQHSITIK